MREVSLMLEKWKHWKWWSIIFNELFIVKQAFVWPQFANCFVAIEHMILIKKGKYLLFLELENIGKKYAFLLNFAKK